MPKAKTVEKLMAKPLQPSSTHTEWQGNQRASSRGSRPGTSIQAQALEINGLKELSGPGVFLRTSPYSSRLQLQAASSFFFPRKPGCLFYVEQGITALSHKFADPITLFLHPKPIDIWHNPKLHPLGKKYASTIYITNDQSLSGSISKLRLDYSSVVSVCRTQKKSRHN
jgi:hypothetical protein